MRVANILALLCSTAALILSFLVLFAGHTKSFLQGDDLLTLNVSRLGHGTVDLFNSSDSDGSFLGNLINSAEAKLDQELDKIVGEISSDIAEAINLPDFYSVHVMDFCSGTFTPNASLAAVGNGSHVSKNTTFCSNSSLLFHFNATKVVSNALPDGINLTTIQWPKEFSDAEHAVKIASLAMEVLYIIGIILTGIAFLLAIVSVFANGRITACTSFFIDFLAFIALLIASIIATVIILKVVHTVNKYGKFLGVSATMGGTWLGMTWAATGLMFVASILACVTIVVGGHHRRGEKRVNEKGDRY